MIRLSPEQLDKQLQRSLSACYLLCGTDPLFLQESLDAIYQSAQQNGFEEKISVVVDNQTDWNVLLQYCQEMSLFSARKILRLQFPDNGLTPAQSKEFLSLLELMHEDILLLLQIPKLTKTLENSAWYQQIDKNCILINCQTPDQQQFSQWLQQRCHKLSLQLDLPSRQLLAFYYEGNLLALSQLLTRLSFLYAEGRPTLLQIEQEVFDASHYSLFQLIDSILAGKSQRALHIAQQLQYEGIELLILVRMLQKELLLLLSLKSQLASHSLVSLFNKNKVWQQRRPLLTQSLERLSFKQLKQAVELLNGIELLLKQEYTSSSWQYLTTLILLLCDKELATLPLELLSLQQF